MTSDLFTQRLAGYLDNEVDPDEARQIHAHLLTCPACAGELATLARMKLGLRSAHLKFEPSAEFRQKVLRQIRRPQGFGRKKFWAYAMVPVLALLLVGLAVRYWDGQRRLSGLGELADLHVATLASANPVDVLSTDRHTVKPWFESRLPFTFDVPELKDTEFTLIGGRVTYLHQAPGAQLIFGFGQHRMSLFVFQDRPDLALNLPSGEADSSNYSYGFHSSAEKGLYFILVGAVEVKEMRKLGEMISAANAK